jgi:hypothetical protein
MAGTVSCSADCFGRHCVKIVLEGSIAVLAHRSPRLRRAVGHGGPGREFPSRGSALYRTAPGHGGRPDWSVLADRSSVRCDADHEKSLFPILLSPPATPLRAHHVGKQTRFDKAGMLHASSEALVRCSAVAADPLVSAGHVKKSDLVRMRPVERTLRLGR